MEESSKNYKEYHPHPLLLVVNKQQLLVRDGRGFLPACSRCRQTAVSAPCLGCEDCGFYLHKVCADAPLELDHPFHLNHPLLLSKMPHQDDTFAYDHRCQFCGDSCKGGSFAYGCSCGLDLHIRCALFTFNIAHNNFKHLDEHVAALEQDPLSVYFGQQYCFFCLQGVEESCRHYSPDCGITAHEKCVKLPLKLNHPCHRKHPLSLQFDHQHSPCKICRNTQPYGFSYVCSPCEFGIHIKCLSPSPTFEDKTYHPHPFNLFLRQASFTCDACGTAGSHAAYTCLECNILVHKECISLPRFIKSKYHDHRVSHTYFLHRKYFTTLDCIICNEEVDTDYGSYCCRFCNVIFHAKCATEDPYSYYIVLDDEESLDLNSFTIIERNDEGEATVIEHCKHIGHHLMLSDRVSEHDDKCCDGCLLPISASFYYCSNSECDFVLHKVCAEFPKEKQVWHHHGCQRQLVLTANECLQCLVCKSFANGFGYKCEECGNWTCLRCIIALTPGVRTHPGHEHPLFFYPKKTGKCNGCGGDAYEEEGLFGCKKCDFCLDRKCFSLPITARHRCDKHRLPLTYYDDNGYSASHYCDICEGGRDPNPWFYHCAECDTSVHVNCAIDQDSSFIKIGSSIDGGNFHPHPLTVVKKMYYYPGCIVCGEPCVDLSLQCGESGCNTIIHFPSCPSDD